eukprot:3145846-Pyramimonas_sp.AAC.1
MMSQAMVQQPLTVMPFNRQVVGAEHIHVGQQLISSFSKRVAMLNAFTARSAATECRPSKPGACLRRLRLEFRPRFPFSIAGFSCDIAYL